MNGEIERAFVAALEPIMDPLPVVARTTTTLLEDGSGCVIVEAKDLERPAGRFWRGTVVFTVDVPALAEADDQMPMVRANVDLVVSWLEDKALVLAGYESSVIELLPGWHIGRTGQESGEDRVTAWVEITAGFIAI